MVAGAAAAVMLGHVAVLWRSRENVVGDAEELSASEEPRGGWRHS